MITQTEDEKYEDWMQGSGETLPVGERVILTLPDPQRDGLRGTVQEAHVGDVYDVKLDEGVVLAYIGRNRLEREADYPNYPSPEPAS